VEVSCQHLLLAVFQMAMLLQVPPNLLLCQTHTHLLRKLMLLKDTNLNKIPHTASQDRTERQLHLWHLLAV
jgi:hypothetical protein